MTTPTDHPWSNDIVRLQHRVAALERQVSPDLLSRDGVWYPDRKYLKYLLDRLNSGKTELIQPQSAVHDDLRAAFKKDGP